MKKFLAFILLLANNLIFACGFYPYGETLRFCFFNPNHFNYKSFSEFNYIANSFSFSYDGIYTENEIDPNEKLWIAFCKNKISVDDVRNYMYDLTFDDINEKSNNKMVQFFFKNKNIEAIEYLKFIKKCEVFTTEIETDPWEKYKILQ